MLKEACTLLFNRQKYAQVSGGGFPPPPKSLSFYRSECGACFAELGDLGGVCSLRRGVTLPSRVGISIGISLEGCSQKDSNTGMNLG